MTKTLLASLLVAGATTVPTSAADLTAEQAKVQAVIGDMTSAFERGDMNAVMASYEPGATVLFEPGTPVYGAAAIKQMFDGAAAMAPKFTYSGHEVVVAGDIAVHFAPWEMAATTPDGMEVRQSGLSVAVLRKQKDGSWLMVIDNPHGQRLMENGH